MDENGYVRVTGRLKDMIIRGGENVYPREIEEFLYQHPKVLDVQVTGVPDEKYGEEVATWIILKEGQTATEEEIRDFLSSMLLLQVLQDLQREDLQRMIKDHYLGMVM